MTGVPLLTPKASVPEPRIVHAFAPPLWSSNHKLPTVRALLFVTVMGPGMFTRLKSAGAFVPDAANPLVQFTPLVQLSLTVLVHTNDDTTITVRVAERPEF